LVGRRKRLFVSFIVSLEFVFVGRARFAFEGESPAPPLSPLDSEAPIFPSLLLGADFCLLLLDEADPDSYPSSVVLLRFWSDFLTREKDIELERSYRRERIIARLRQRHRDIDR
jgi:hypothetical protein